MTEAEHTKIQVSRQLRDRLRALKEGAETYDDVIRRLVSESTIRGLTHNTSTSTESGETDLSDSGTGGVEE